MQPLNSLQLVSTEDLLTELQSRHDAIIFSSIRFTKLNGDYVVVRKNSGNRMVCLGLLETLKQKISFEELSSQNIIPYEKKDDV